MATRTKRRSTRRVERRKGPRDRLVILAMIAIPTILVVWLVWIRMLPGRGREPGGPSGGAPAPASA